MRRAAGFHLAAVAGACLMGLASAVPAAAQPAFRIDPAWPQTLPNNWILGQASGLAVDAKDNVWVLQRPRSLTDDERAAALTPPTAKCCLPAPPVIEFSPEGKVLRSWGGPGAGYDWPQNEHGLFIDPKGFVWIGGNGPEDGQILKFTQDGRFVLQIGKQGPQTHSNDVTRLGKAADFAYDAATDELYVADGYYNRRIIVFDANTGAYKRHWGAYGRPPQDPAAGAGTPTTYVPGAPPSQQFGVPVHCVALADDGLVYVCDRTQNRVQVFRKDGTFVKEWMQEPNTRFMGAAWDLALIGAGQEHLLVGDGMNNEVRLVKRDTGTVVSAFGQPGRRAGDFHWVHNLALNSRGELFTTEVDTGKRVQKFIPTETAPR